MSTAKRTLILQDTPKRCLVLQVNKKVKEIPKVLLGRSQVQVLVFMLWLTLCSFNFKNLTKISISLNDQNHRRLLLQDRPKKGLLFLVIQKFKG